MEKEFLPEHPERVLFNPDGSCQGFSFNTFPGPLPHQPVLLLLPRSQRENVTHTLCHRSVGKSSDGWILGRCRIPPNIRDIVYCTGVSLMDEDVWEFIWMKFHSSNAVSEKKILLEALTCSDNIFLLNRYTNNTAVKDFDLMCKKARF